ncbi:unnamed protein product, partial [Notodromas monacha]
MKSDPSWVPSLAVATLAFVAFPVTLTTLLLSMIVDRPLACRLFNCPNWLRVIYWVIISLMLSPIPIFMGFAVYTVWKEYREESSDDGLKHTTQNGDSDKSDMDFRLHVMPRPPLPCRHRSSLNFPAAAVVARVVTAIGDGVVAICGEVDWDVEGASSRRDRPKLDTASVGEQAKGRLSRGKRLASGGGASRN